MSLFHKHWLYFWAIFLVLFFYLVYLGAEKSNKLVQVCKSRGGVPQTERGIYKNCLKTENFIDIGARQ